MLTDDEKRESAKAHYDRMKRYCLLHHEKRIADFSKPCDPGWDPSVVHRLVEQSQRIVNGDPNWWGSVDLDDVEYIAELDAWEASGKP